MDLGFKPTLFRCFDRHNNILNVVPCVIKLTSELGRRPKTTYAEALCKQGTSIHNEPSGKPENAHQTREKNGS